MGRVTKERCDARLDAWSRAVVAKAGIVLELEGRKWRAPGQRYVVMSNHQSLYDVPVLFRVFGPDIRMVAKRELFDVPVFGGAMRAAGFIAINRADARASLRTFGEARGRLDEGTLVWIAPEGTRSLEGEVLPFKPGGFQLAIDAQAPILPVTLDGTRHVMPPGSLRSTTGAAVRVTIHPPVYPPARGSGPAARRALMQQVRGAIESAVGSRQDCDDGHGRSRSSSDGSGRPGQAIGAAGQVTVAASRRAAATVNSSGKKTNRGAM
jgi:1-acyl-sn-glycerol-3-phosphate acyltransferase